MNNSAAYRATAEACAKLAQTVEDIHVKLILLNMAEAWLRLADHVERRARHEGGEPLGIDHNVTSK